MMSSPCFASYIAWELGGALMACAGKGGGGCSSSLGMSSGISMATRELASCKALGLGQEGVSQHPITLGQGVSIPAGCWIKASSDGCMTKAVAPANIASAHSLVKGLVSVRGGGLSSVVLVSLPSEESLELSLISEKLDEDSTFWLLAWQARFFGGGIS